MKIQMFPVSFIPFPVYICPKVTTILTCIAFDYFVGFLNFTWILSCIIYSFSSVFHLTCFMWESSFMVTLWYSMLCIGFVFSSVCLGSLLVWDHLKPSSGLEILLCGCWVLISVPKSCAMLSKQRSCFSGLANILRAKVA